MAAEYSLHSPSCALKRADMGLSFAIVVSLSAILCTATSLYAAPAVTARSGDWTNPATWGGTPPLPQEPAEIAAGHIVTFDAPSAEVANLTVRGTLRVARDRSTQLAVRCNLIVYGVLDMGRKGDEIPKHVTHNLVFKLTQAKAAAFVGGAHFAATDCGLWAMGRFDAHGALLTRAWGKLNGDVAAGATKVTVDGDVSDWPVGSQIVLTQTADGLIHSVASGANRYTSRNSEAEYLTIAAVQGSTLTLTTATRFAHSGKAPFRGEVGLMTRNVTISTELEGATNIATDVRVRKFAHVMFMPTSHGDGSTITHSGGASGNIEYIAFRHMGHYGKLGRYALHYHRLGNGSRGMQVRGVSWFQSGFRCTNIHESNGMTVEDTVCVNPGNGAAHFVEVDEPTQQADSVFVHNLVTNTTPQHFSDRNNSSLTGERLRKATGFWPGASEHEAHLGNVSAGPSLDKADATGYHWPEDHTSTNGTIARVFVANEAHSHTFVGFHSWQNKDRGHDLVGISAWGNSDGFLQGAYIFELAIYNALFARQRVGYRLSTTFGLVQDSTFIGRGAGGTRLINAADNGIQFGNYSIQPHPWKGSRYLRNTFRDLTPDTAGRKGVAIWRDADKCTSAADELNWPARYCSSSFPRLAQNTFGPDVHPYRFGWMDGPRPFYPNVNSFWLDYDRKLILLRKDQKTPQGQFPPKLVNASSFYDSVADALATPFSALPSSITFTKLLDYRNRAYPDVTLQFDYNPPPSVSLTTELSGTQLRMTAAASSDTQRVEFWVDWVLVATDRTAPFEAVIDISRLAQYGDILPARRWAYAYARAFDGVFINRQNPTDAGYEQRAYSAIVELTPEARRQGLTSSFVAAPQSVAAGGESRALGVPQADSWSPSATAPSAGAVNFGAFAVVTAEEAHLKLAPVFSGVARPSDLAFAADGSIFVAERAGKVRLVRKGVPVGTLALDVSSEVSEPGGGLLAIAIAPKFEATGMMYVLYAADMPRGGREFVLARVRYVNGVFGERAVLLRTPMSTETATGALRVGPDGKLYVALASSAGDPLDESAATYSGKVLRLNLDGTTPDDQPRSTPVFSTEHPQPHALDWQPATGDLWVLDRIGTDSGRLSVIPANAGRESNTSRTSYALPPATGPTSAAFYRSNVISIFKDNLFIAAESGRELLRLRFDPDNPSRVISTERLLKDQIGTLRVVAEGRDGALYVGTDSGLYRLEP